MIPTNSLIRQTDEAGSPSGMVHVINVHKAMCGQGGGTGGFVVIDRSDLRRDNFCQQCWRRLPAGWRPRA